MAMFGSNMAGEVGLRLLLCPLGSNVVTRTACCSVGMVLPVYSTFKAIETRDQNEQQKWLLYWAAYGSFSIVEMFTDKFLYWFPLYYQMKFAFLVWLQLPSVEAKFVSAHQAEFQFAKTLLRRILLSARDIIRPGQQINGAVEGPREHVETSESEDEE
ncbi:HVA22-like protein k isoform X2 [Coffea arabica]|uniref:HVA22-like protein n=1 Tax=Coffea arabica TaxID=13443 RepID=A0A6P6WBA1_COFAR|nr:HVA22-like protein k isoform X2 [Coffea arabica]